VRSSEPPDSPEARGRSGRSTRNSGRSTNPSGIRSGGGLRAWVASLWTRVGQRFGRLLRRVLVAFVVLSLLEVGWVRFLPPLTTLTMLERQREAWQAGKPMGLEREWVGLEEVSPYMVQALLAGEDARFFQHFGFELGAIRDAWVYNSRDQNQRKGRVRGASTLSQQTARNLFVWQHRSWLRKGLETYYTVLIELLLPKERILTLYLNVAEWGDQIFGVEAAAQHYFHKHAKDLSRVEAAALSASLPNPRKYPPTGSTKFQRHRQELILSRMSRIKPEDYMRVDVEED